MSNQILKRFIKKYIDFHQKFSVEQKYFRMTKIFSDLKIFGSEIGQIFFKNQNFENLKFFENGNFEISKKSKFSKSKKFKTGFRQGV